MPSGGTAQRVERVAAIVQQRHDAAHRPALSVLDLARAAGFEPDTWQASVLTSTSPRLLLNASRQSGKSTVTALLALHTALTEANSLVLLVSPTLRQSAELLRKVTDAYGAIGLTVPAESESVLKLELMNGSRILSLPGAESTVRGYSGCRLLVIDEASRVATDLYSAIRPTLAVSSGRLIALSTPHGRRGWWSDAWHSAENWERYEIPATACPRISPEFLEEEQRNLGEWWYLQEYMCVFMDGQTSAFSFDDVERLFSDEVPAWNL